MPVFVIFAIIYVVLIVALLIEIFLGFEEKFKEKKRIFTIILMTLFLGLISFKPKGLVDFDKLLLGEDLLFAQVEGTANCTKTLILKRNNQFKERSVCFGVSEIKGYYEIVNDTIFFTKTNTREEELNYKFAVFEKSHSGNEDILTRYRNKNDSIGHSMKIYKNRLLNQ